MSKPTKGKSRYGGIDSLRAPAPVEPAPAAPAPDDKLETFSTTLMGSTKVLLKKAAADERRKQYELLEQAIADYLEKHHPNLK